MTTQPQTKRAAAILDAAKQHTPTVTPQPAALAAPSSTPSSQALVAARQAPLLSFDDIEKVSKAFVGSGWFKDSADPAKAIVKILAGQELGIGPMQAMQGIHIIEGKPSLSAGLVGALIKRSGRYDYRIAVRTDDECTIAWYERGEHVGDSTFTVQDARRAGVNTKATWQRYPKSMLFARALTDGARTFCPDVFGGAVYVAEELGALVDADGEVVGGAAPVAAPPAAHTEPVVVEVAREEPLEDAVADQLAELTPAERRELRGLLERNGVIGAGDDSLRKIAPKLTRAYRDAARDMPRLLEYLRGLDPPVVSVTVEGPMDDEADGAEQFQDYLDATFADAEQQGQLS